MEWDYSGRTERSEKAKKEIKQLTKGKVKQKDRVESWEVKE